MALWSAGYFWVLAMRHCGSTLEGTVKEGLLMATRPGSLLRAFGVILLGVFALGSWSSAPRPADTCAGFAVSWVEGEPTSTCSGGCDEGTCDQKTIEASPAITYLGCACDDELGSLNQCCNVVWKTVSGSETTPYAFGSCTMCPSGNGTCRICFLDGEWKPSCTPCN